NKALLAHHGAEIFLAARKKGVDLYFEASVAGGIPVIKGLREGLIGNEVEGIYGILNGTSNYILSEMGKGEGRSFEAALAEAQQRGYAERNPRLDLNGMDTAHKLSVLTLLAFGRAILPEKMHVEGINGITADDIRNAAGFGSVIKLLGIAKRSGRSLEARVHPVLLPKNHPLASVHGVHNAVSVKGDWVGELMLTGQGAGRRPTTSAVVADIVDVARNLAFGTPQRVPLPGPNKDIRQIRRIGQLEGRYYFRFACIDRPGVLSRISQILGSHRISIASMVQKDRRRDQVVPLIMTTHEARERDVHAALKLIGKLSIVRGKPVRIRMERA
ncbi:MAG: homoserine dehydrogenase, partial [Candidatus Omnitrophica bacterium CG11_big_fil_rev_8_21_14_0_20_64_10]